MRRDIALLSQHFQRVSFQTNVFLEQLKSHNKRKTRIPDTERCGRVRRWHFLCFWCSELNVITLAGKFPTQRFHMGKILPGNKTGNFLSAKMFFQTWKSWQLCWQTEITRCASVVLRSIFFFFQTGFSSIITGSVTGLPLGGAGPVDRVSIKHET